MRIAWVLAATLAGCGDATGPPAQHAVPDELWIHATGLVMDAGDTVSLGVTAWDDRAHQYYSYPLGEGWGFSAFPRWWSSDSAVAVVDGRGRVAARGAGRAEVWVAVGERMDSASIFVRPSTGLVDLRFRNIHAGGTVTCGLTEDAEAYCWGFGWDGAVGSGRVRQFTNVASPVPVAGGHRFASLSVAGRHACGLTSGGEAYCWGSNLYGGLGDGTELWNVTSGIVTGRGTPVRVKTNRRFTMIAAGAGSTCALDAAGQAYCWGWNLQGSTGTGSFNVIGGVTEPSPVINSPSFVTIESGGFHYCGLTSSGEAYCWGDNTRGYLGAGLGPERCWVGDCATRPVPVHGGLRFVALAAGRETCGLTAGGAVFCWGEIGDSIVRSPRLLENAPPFSAITSAGVTCGLTSSGEAYCWGENGWGSLGNGQSNWSYVPVPQRVGIDEALAEVSAGGGGHACGVTLGGDGYCWGLNDHGQLGTGQVTPFDAAFISFDPLPARVLGVP